MPLYPIFFLIVVTLGSAMSLVRGPIYGLITYVFIYFNLPAVQWWGVYLPDLRWSLISAGLLTFSSLIHYRQLGKVPFSLKSPATYLVLLFLLMCAIAPFAYSPPLAWEKVYDFFRYVYIYILTALILVDEKKYKTFLFALFGCFLYLAWQAHFFFRGGRLDGIGLPDARDANMMAALILLIFPFLIQTILYGSRREKLFSLIVLVPVTNVFMMCGSRGGFLGLVAGVAVLLGLQLRNKQFCKMLFVVCAVIVGFFGLMDNNYKERLFGLKRSVQTWELEQNSSGRILIWKESLPILQDYPFGAGGGGFMELSPYYISEELIEGSTGKRASHNTYLQIIIEQGPAGLLIYLLFVGNTFKMVNLRSSNHNENFSKNQSQGLVSALIAFFVASLFIDRVYFEFIYIMASLSLVLNFSTEKNMLLEKVGVKA